MRLNHTPPLSEFPQEFKGLDEYAFRIIAEAESSVPSADTINALIYSYRMTRELLRTYYGNYKVLKERHRVVK